MSQRQLLWNLVKRYPLQAFGTIAFGFSGAIFTGIGTALLVPILLDLLGQDIGLDAAPALLKSILAPFQNLPEAYRSIVMTLTVVGLIGLKNLTTYLSAIVSGMLQRNITAELRRQGLSIILEVDLIYYNQARMGDITNRLGNETGRVSSTVSSYLKLAIVTISLGAMVAILLALSWQLTIAATALFSLVVLVNQLFVSQARRYGRALSKAAKDYSIATLEVLSGMRLVRASGTERREFERINGLIKKRELMEFRSQVNSAATGPVAEVSSIVCLMAIVAISRALFADRLDVLSTVLLTYLTVLFRTLPLVGQLNGIRSSLANTSASVEIIRDFLSRTNKPFMATGDRPFGTLEESIRLEDLCFSYDGGANLTLKHLNLTIPKGKTVALVGGSGAGKSTLVDLLPRFSDPIAGRILLDGVDLREFNIQSLRRSMGIVSQETFLFNDTVRNNIAYACPDATDEQVIEAAKRANAYEFIAQLPKGFDTPIGDRGVMLSGGQRQRLAIARALLQNPPILILDEATSALDTVSERLVQQALDELSRDRTVIVIAHRLSTVKNADKIVVLEKGELMEEGTHDELLALGSYYARLYNMQFGGTAQQLVTANETFNRTSYEIRSRLNVTLGSMQLLADDLVDSQQEASELLQEAYKSSIRMLSTMELFEDSLQMQKNLYAKQGQRSPELTARYELFTTTSYDVRTRLNVMISGLRFLADDLADTPEETAQMLAEAYDAALEVFNTLEALESTGNAVPL
ncbi:MAG: ABC transporter ATP-binding protein/permease [Cyanobacteria bacterium]|nr:ABC transporter ATP-binding protein/permease [Cyanobacteriota bacterium]